MEQNTTFWNLLEEYEIKIPLIQRDYAQGRIEEEEKRKKFLKKIFEAVTDTNLDRLILDFVYGKVQHKVFYPIDGQQRLTTLFLLHWYFSRHKRLDPDFSKICTRLQKFVYDTRISSREFCRELSNYDISLTPEIDGDELVEIIKDKNWYRDLWNTDPTVKAMLIMIRDIHDNFKENNPAEIWDNLTVKKRISFEILDMGRTDFDLTDELYIKMNARGKQLTPFENFKANFIDLIEKLHKDEEKIHPIKGPLSYADYFSFSIEKEWADLFWSYRNESNSIDSEMYNYFEFVLQMCFFKDFNLSLESFQNTYEQYQKVFSSKDNIDFLFNSLDKLSEVSRGEKGRMKYFFEQIYTIPNENATSKITLFWNDVNTDFFEEILKKGTGAEASLKILFFSQLWFAIKLNECIPSPNFKYFLRTIRNLLRGLRQRNDLKYNSNIRINEFGNYWKLFLQLVNEDVLEILATNKITTTNTSITNERVSDEMNKATVRKKGIELDELEENQVFGGLIHKILPFLTVDNYQTYSNAISNIFSSNNESSEIINVLIAHGFEGIEIKETSIGKSYYFGRKGNWEFVLTSSEKDCAGDVINNLVKDFMSKTGTVSERMAAIKTEYLTAVSKFDWRYYFVKYPVILSRLNYYAWPSDFEARLLGSDKRSPLLAYHINIFVLAVSKEIDDGTESQCYAQYLELSPLVLKNGLKMYSIKDGWLISGSDKIITEDIISKFTLSLHENGWMLQRNNDDDQVQLAINFIKSLQSK